MSQSIQISGGKPDSEGRDCSKNLNFDVSRAERRTLTTLPWKSGELYYTKLRAIAGGRPYKAL